MPRKEIYDYIRLDNDFRQVLAFYLTDADDPYFDVFLAATCFALPQQNLEKLVTGTESPEKALNALKKATICKIGKGAYSRAFRLFGRNYLAVSEPRDSTYLDAPSPETYEGTTIVEKPLDLENFLTHSLAGEEFCITLSHSLLGDPEATHLIAGTFSRDYAVRGQKHKHSAALASIRNMLAVFSNITQEQGISIHRCDSRFFRQLSDEHYLGVLGFTLETLLDPVIKGGFIEKETIAVLRKTHAPYDGVHHIYVGDSQFLEVKNGKCKSIERLS